MDIQASSQQKCSPLWSVHLPSLWHLWREHVKLVARWTKNTSFEPIQIYIAQAHKWNSCYRSSTATEEPFYQAAGNNWLHIQGTPAWSGPSLYHMIRPHWKFASTYTVFSLRFNCFVGLDNLLELLFCSICTSPNICVVLLVNCERHEATTLELEETQCPWETRCSPLSFWFWSGCTSIAFVLKAVCSRWSLKVR